MNTWRGKRSVQNPGQCLGRFHPMADAAISLYILDEIRVAVLKAPIIKAHVGLFPADHTVRVIVQD